MESIETTADIEAGLAALVLLDPSLAAVVDRAGAVPLRRRPATIGSLMQIVVSQQVSVQSAAAIWGRFEDAFDVSNTGHIAGAPDADLQAVGLSRPKVKTIRAIAVAHQEGLDVAALSGLSADAVAGILTKIHGVGPWTAEIFSLFCLGDPDVFPVGDIALQQAVMDALDLPERPKGDALAEITARWSPWRGVAARLFWAYYAANKNRAALPV